MNRKGLIESMREGNQKFNGVAFWNADLSGLNLSGCFFVKADFEGANLEGANFTGANLADADFTGANIRAAIFKGARLERTRLALAKNVDQADFAGANLLVADLFPSQLEELGVERPTKEYSPYASYNDGRHPFRPFS
jgi:uncharacterized protein YjbI with pentapeptide repeats